MYYQLPLFSSVARSMGGGTLLEYIQNDYELKITVLQRYKVKDEQSESTGSNV